jgi:hypothetical protein
VGPAAVRERDGGQCAFVGERGHRCTERKGLQYDHVDPVARGGRATVEGIRLLCRAHNQYEAVRTFGAGFMDEKRAEARAAKRLRACTLPDDARPPADPAAKTLGAAAEARATAETCAPAEARATAEVCAAAEARTLEELRTGAQARAEEEARAAGDVRAEARTEAEAQAAEEARRAEEARAIAKQHAQDVLAGLRGLGVRAELARRAAEYSETLQDVTLEQRMRAALGFIRPRTRVQSQNRTSLPAT